MISGCASQVPAERGEVRVPPAVASVPEGDPLLRATLDEWRGAHDMHDHARLEKLYASHVRYQGFSLDRDVLLRLKEAEFSRSPATRRTVTHVREDRARPDLPVLHFRATTKGTNRIFDDETTLTLSCDRHAARDCDGVPCRAGEKPYCEVVGEESLGFADAIARGRALMSRPGSCPAALVEMAASSADAKELVGSRELSLVAMPVAMPPESTRYAVVILGTSFEPKALYEIEPLTFEMTEVLPGDVVQKPDPAKREHAKRACGGPR